MEMKITSEIIWNGFITIGGVICFIVLFICNYRLKKLKNKCENKNNQIKEVTIDYTSKGVQTEEKTSSQRNYDDDDKLRTDYGKLSAKTNSWIQLITIFPMIGLLGTVWGIRQWIFGGGAVDQNMTELSTALTTTLFGLGCAMVLKVYSIVAPIRVMEIIEYKLSEADRKFQQHIGTIQIANMSEDKKS